MPPQLTITAGRATFAVVGVPTAAVGTSAVILATGGAVLLIGGGIYLAARNSQTQVPALTQPDDKEIGR